MCESIDRRTWGRRIGTLNGLFWGVVIAAGIVTYIRRHGVANPTELTVAQYALLCFVSGVVSLPLGVFVSCRIMSLGHARSSNSSFRTPIEMTDSRFLRMLHRWEAVTTILLVIDFWHQLWPVVPHKILAFSMTFSIVSSLFVLIMAGWAAHVRRGRFYGRHAMLGIVFTLATVSVWVLALQPVNTG